MRVCDSCLLVALLACMLAVGCSDEVDVPCEPDCTNRHCGLDPLCGESCGICATNEDCTEAGVCECNNVTCNDLCCTSGQVCHQDACCLPDCTDKQCGGDGCGGSCGDCSDGFVCNAEGQCVEESQFAHEYQCITAGGSHLSSDHYRLKLFIAPTQPVGSGSSQSYRIRFGPGSINAPQ